MYQCWAECWYHLVCDDHCSVKYERVTYCQQPPAHADLSPILQTSGVETKIHNYKTSQQQYIEHTWHNHQMRNDKFTEKHWLQIYVLSLSSFSFIHVYECECKIAVFNASPECPHESILLRGSEIYLRSAWDLDLLTCLCWEFHWCLSVLLALLLDSSWLTLLTSENPTAALLRMESVSYRTG